MCRLAVGAVMLGWGAIEGIQLHAAELVQKEGTVEMAKAGAPLRPATVGAALVLRDRLGTGESSRAVLKMSAGWTARVDEITLIEITETGIAALDRQMLKLERGQAFIYSREAKGEWKIQTPAGEGIGRGTQIVVRVTENGETFFQVIEGELNFANALGRVALTAGEAGEATPRTAPRQTAVIETRSLLQWALYYPAVLLPMELGVSEGERQALAASLGAYEQGDLHGALEKYPAGFLPVSVGAKLYRAGVLLATGQVTEARAVAQDVAEEHPGRRALERMLAAVMMVEQSAVFPMTTAGEALAESYYQQSRRDLEAARAAAKRSTELAPQSGFTWTRLAELEFSFGRTAAARAALDRGLALSPLHAQAHALRGFLLSAEHKIEAARQAFERAIQLDSALGNGWLGLGLTKIKSGQLAAGRADLQMAATVEPTRSFFYSYHAKAVGQDENATLAAKDLSLAKQLDPADPTPWLYSALHEQQNNRYNAAMDDLRMSLSLNDHRRMYRSTFLLDQDRAVRSSNLASIYQNAGMADLAVQEATRAVEGDYANASSHLFLANSFDALRDPTRSSLRFETAWFNEQLLASLLAPVGGGPLSQFVSQQEYSKLLESDGMGASSAGEWRSDGRRELRTSLYATYDRLSAGFDFSYFENDATRTLQATVRKELYGQIKYQIGADDVVYSLVKWHRQVTHDAHGTYRPSNGAEENHYRERQNPGLLLLGGSRRWAPGIHTLFVGGRLAADETLGAAREPYLIFERDPGYLFSGFLQLRPDGIPEYTDSTLRNALPPPVSTNPDGSRSESADFRRTLAPFLGRGEIVAAGLDFLRSASERRFVVYSGELQQIWQTRQNTLIAGVRGQEGEFKVKARIDLLDLTNAPFFASPPSDDHGSVGFERQSAYVYDFLRVTPWLTLIGGASWDRVERPENFRTPPVSDRAISTSRTNAKAGFTLAPSPDWTVRGVYAESLGGVSFDESVRLEPVQLAGFGQAFRTVINESLVGSVEAPVYQLAALSVNARWPTRTWAWASLADLREKAERTRGVFDVLYLPTIPAGIGAFPSDTTERFRYREQTMQVGVNQLVGGEFALGVTYGRTWTRLRWTLPEIPVAQLQLADRRELETLHQLSLAMNWNSPSGWWGRAEAERYSQHGDTRYAGTSIAGLPATHFWRVNVQLGWRFHRGAREVSVGALNLTDTDRRLRTLTAPRDLVEERTIFLRYRVRL